MAANSIIDCGRNAEETVYQLCFTEMEKRDQAIGITADLRLGFMPTIETNLPPGRHLHHGPLSPRVELPKNLLKIPHPMQNNLVSKRKGG